MYEKILQIISATGWYARFGQNDADLSPLVCGALCQNDDGENYVAGMNATDDGVTDFVESADNFEGYIFKS